MKLLTVPVLASLLIACAIDEEDFPDKYAETMCDRLLECDSDGYDDIWDSDEECQDDWAYLTELFLDLNDLVGETYDGAKGRDCVQDLKSISCDDLEDGEHECDPWLDD